MEGGSVVYDEGTGTDAFHGLDVEAVDQSHTSVRLQVDGALRFVVGENARALCYDQNGNMTWRLKQGAAYEQQWNADNRLTYVKDWGELAIITFTYDANGVLLAKGTVTDTTVYVGGIYEKELTSGDETLYFFFGGQRIAMEEEGTLTYLVGDHLGTTSVVLSSAGALVAESRHYPYGEERWSSGTVPTDYRFTGQLLEHDLSIYIMGARWYDPSVARWLSADTVVPDPARPQSLNGYAYVYGCPLSFTDPSGNCPPEDPWCDLIMDVEPCAISGDCVEPFLLWPYQGDQPSGIYLHAGQRFGDPRDGGSRSHEGMDMIVRSGEPGDPVDPFEVRSPASGTARSGWTRNSGNLASIGGIPDHPDVTVILMHFDLWEEGQVSAGDPIGTARKQGNATNDALHIEVHINGEPRNPVKYMVFPRGTRFYYTDPETGIPYLVYVPAREPAMGLPSSKTLSLIAR